MSHLLKSLSKPALLKPLMKHVVIHQKILFTPRGSEICLNRKLLEWNQAKLSEGYHFDSEFWILAHFYLKGIYLFVALACSLLQKRLKNKWDILFWDNVRSLLSAQLALQQTDLLSAVQLPSQLFFNRFLQQKQACCCVNTTETNKILRPVEQFFHKNLLSSHCSECFNFYETRIGP